MTRSRWTSIVRLVAVTGLTVVLALPGEAAQADSSPATAITAGTYHTCARLADGSVWCWGSDAHGQLGDGTTGDASHHRLTPVRVRKGTGYLGGVTAIAAGVAHTCALRTNGSVWCWGYAASGAVGDGTRGDPPNGDRLTPVRVRRGSGYLDGVTAIAAGGTHTCARRTDGSVWCWGNDAHGELGDGTTGDALGSRLTPVQVRQGSGNLDGVTVIAAGTYHTCARRTDGSVWCWGGDEHGQLGDGTTGDAVQHLRLAPVRVIKGSGDLDGVTMIVAGSYHTCARRTGGSAWCWGYDDFGQLGDGTTGDANGDRLAPVRVRKGTGYLDGVTAIAAGEPHTCARRTDGSAWCWGNDLSGEIGDGTRGDANHHRLAPVRVHRGSGYLDGVTAIAAGYAHTCARRANGSVWCWGSDLAGELGDGTTGDVNHLRLTPVRVELP